MNMFVPMSEEKVKDNNFISNLAKHFKMHYRNADNIIKRLEGMEKKTEKKPEKKK